MLEIFSHHGMVLCHPWTCSMHWSSWNTWEQSITAVLECLNQVLVLVHTVFVMTHSQVRFCVGDWPHNLMQFWQWGSRAVAPLVTTSLSLGSFAVVVSLAHTSTANVGPNLLFDNIKFWFQFWLIVNLLSIFHILLWVFCFSWSPCSCRDTGWRSSMFHSHTSCVLSTPTRFYMCPHGVLIHVCMITPNEESE